MEERPWVEWKNDKPITPRQIAKLLEQFKVKPDTIRTAVGTAKGYMLEDFTDAFARYTADRSVTPEQVNKINGLLADQSVTRGDLVLRIKIAKNPMISRVVTVLRMKTPFWAKKRNVPSAGRERGRTMRCLRPTRAPANLGCIGAAPKDKSRCCRRSVDGEASPLN